VIVAATVVAATFGAGPAASAGTPTPASCAVRITTFRFDPDVAAQGTSTTLIETIRNCTGVARHVTLTQYGTEPQGCPVLDPISRGVDLRPHQRKTFRSQWTAPDCVGKMRLYLRVNGSNGTEFDAATAVLRVT
jgi:hypothetical protein